MFVAVQIPRAAADAVQAAIEPWLTVLPRVRWVPRENWHLTMRFLGSTTPSLVPWVRERLARVAEASAPFETSLRGLGGFPSLHRAHVLWAGVDDDRGRLAALAVAINESLASELEPEGRPFTPHVTVGRSDKKPLALQGGFGRTSLESDRFGVKELVLMRSHLRRPAPVYERIEAYSIRDPA